MHGAKEIIHEAEALPVEERAIIIDSLLRTLNTPTPDIDAEWVELAEQRLRDLRSEPSKKVGGNEVFGRIRKQLEK